MVSLTFFMFWGDKTAALNMHDDLVSSVYIWVWKKALSNNQYCVSLWDCIVMLSSRVTELKISRSRETKAEQ